MNRCRFSPLLNLPFLSYLSLVDNQFSDPIPASFSALSALRHLNLSNNAFNATFPSNLARLANLQVLDLYNNNMTGPLLLAITAMPLLHHLHLGGNFFSSQIPPEYGTCGIPPEIRNLSQLVRFDAAYCELFDDIPVDLRRLQNMDTLFLQVNALSSLLQVLSSVLSPTSLEAPLKTYSHDLPEEAPRCDSRICRRATALEVLQLWENNFTRSITQSLGRNGKLSLVDLPPDMCYENTPVFQEPDAVDNLLHPFFSNPMSYSATGDWDLTNS
ncbi:hypothetical protein VIGAN_UM045900 [Vigna angularis var. angularis]|uniref:Leucine-rich repeat-containing N-terminal plant-type domain-containing protein n=1 Tax=Vigna angularis var. angularis TaxID=157739 RepID=A0A0S3TDR3_PHAAN|nr:hypothetical protein VIGAN_UM045900 [Vigna angularis var. angularis]